MTDRKWIITPAWDADTERHAIEVWTPKYQDFTPKQARQFAAALVEMAEIVDGIAGGTGGSSTDG
ncbi:hypothetical protein AOC05_05075 [Arthrobacter alpinus]|uniref:Uncharacterized protein n=2 Tax=Arthrobacter alpinus TaxID=656366 RepID=A0A0M3UFS5_9MICC|nr:hypothetical protein AOC05_05075 [Arthrobacter alpinus]